MPIVRSEHIPRQRPCGFPRDNFAVAQDSAVPEIAAGMFEILKQNVTADKSGLYRSLAAQCGVTRVGKAINEAMDAALNVLLQNNSIVTDGDQISLKYSRTRGRCL